MSKTSGNKLRKVVHYAKQKPKTICLTLFKQALDMGTLPQLFSSCNQSVFICPRVILQLWALLHRSNSILKTICHIFILNCILLHSYTSLNLYLDLNFE